MPSHCPQWVATHPLAVVVDEVVLVLVDVAELVDHLVVPSKMVVLLVVVDVLTADVVDVTSVVLVLDAELAELTEPEPQPMREEPMAMSSYQNVLASLPYDSHPKNTPVGVGLTLLRAHALELGLAMLGPIDRPGT
jgi:hypothetical protein